MVAKSKDLWSLVLDHQVIAPQDLAEAIQDESAANTLDFRTRLLIRDSIDALSRYWGQERTETWLAECPAGVRIESIRGEDLGPPGFPFLRKQIMEPTRPETVKQMLRDIGGQLHHTVRIYVGGSIALILTDYLSRPTQDLDVVDEVPAEIRKMGRSLDRIMEQYRLQVAHFQSHYLPSGWANRVHSLEPFGMLQVFLVDVYDIFLGKVFSRREKDRDDLRFLAPQLDKEVLERRFRDTTTPLQSDEGLLERAKENWYILFGEPLPS